MFLKWCQTNFERQQMKSKCRTRIVLHHHPVVKLKFIDLVGYTEIPFGMLESVIK